jgi:hypothetical protein
MERMLRNDFRNDLPVVPRLGRLDRETRSTSKVEERAPGVPRACSSTGSRGRSYHGQQAVLRLPAPNRLCPRHAGEDG